MLTNCRALRSGTEDYDFVRAHYELFMPGRGGNLAFFRIRCDGPAPRSAQTAREHDPGRATIYYYAEADRWYVFARNVPRSSHSEAVCTYLFRQYFGSARRHAAITYVFTEREPCHGRGSRECMQVLNRLLVTDGFGAYGATTPVRFLEYYLSKEEADMSAKISLRDSRSVNQENRQNARDAAKNIRSGLQPNP